MKGEWSTRLSSSHEEGILPASALDAATGLPTAARLSELGLGDIAAELKQKNLVP